jgi:predicted protein tyrosine phosphatase
VRRRRFGEALSGVQLHVLGIPDRYEFMAPELVRLLEEGAPEALGS